MMNLDDDNSVWVINSMYEELNSKLNISAQIFSIQKKTSKTKKKTSLTSKIFQEQSILQNLKL